MTKTITLKAEDYLSKSNVPIDENYVKHVFKNLASVAMLVDAEAQTYNFYLRDNVESEELTFTMVLENRPVDTVNLQDHPELLTSAVYAFGMLHPVTKEYDPVAPLRVFYPTEFNEEGTLYFYGFPYDSPYDNILQKIEKGI